MTKIKEKEVSQSEIKIVDLFCGIGGFRKGFEQTGIKTNCVLSADIDEYATAVYNYNFKENKKPTDITKLKSEDIPDHDILCSGFPCQNFSIAGKRKGFNGTRGTLFFEICRIARDKKTPVLFLENVKGLLSHGNRTTGIFYDKCKKTYSTEQTRGSEEVTFKPSGETFGIITDKLYELGYVGEAGVINSKYHGVPQNRERVFIVANLGTKCRRKIFPLGQISKEVVKLQRQQGIANTIKARHNADANGSYIIEREQLSQKEIEPPKLTELTTDKPQGQHVYDSIGLSCTLSSQGGGMGAKTGLYAIPVEEPQLTEITSGKSQGERVYDPNGLSCTISSQGGGMGAKTGLYCVGTIPMTAKKRVHKTPKKINEYLRNHKLPYTLQEISENLNIPKTQIEHYFRTDSSRSIPTPEIWFKLKKLLDFGNKYDKQVTEIYEKEIEFEQTRRVYNDAKGLSPTLNATKEPYVIPVLTPDRPNKRQNGRRFKENGEPMFTLTAQDRHGVMINQLNNARQGKRVYGADGISPTLTSHGNSSGGVPVPFILKKPYVKIPETTNQRIRRLVPVECEKLQGFPVDWTKYGIIDGKKILLSDTQRYKMTGNSVTTNVIEAIAREILKGDIR